MTSLIDAEALALGAILGAVAGSFFATAVLREANGDVRLTGRSACDHCGEALGYSETLPLISYLSRRGACASCASPIDRLHPWGEALGLGVGLSLAAMAVFTPTSVAALLCLAIIGFALLALGLHDLRTQRIPDALTGLVLLASLGFELTSRTPAGILAHLAWGGGVFAALALVRWVFRRTRGVEGLGFGDVKLMGALALWCGPLSPWVLTLACGLALVVRALRRNRAARFPFAPYLAASAWALGMYSELSWPS